jgi:hypothetical protein
MARRKKSSTKKRSRRPARRRKITMRYRHRVRVLKIGVRRVKNKRHYRYVRGGRFAGGRGRGHRGGHYKNPRQANRYFHRALPYKK